MKEETKNYTFIHLGQNANSILLEGSTQHTPSDIHQNG